MAAGRSAEQPFQVFRRETAAHPDFRSAPEFERLPVGPDGPDTSRSGGNPMGKTGRKRRARKKKAANHGKRPNA